MRIEGESDQIQIENLRIASHAHQSRIQNLRIEGESDQIQNENLRIESDAHQ